MYLSNTNLFDGSDISSITTAKCFVLLTQYCTDDKTEKNEMGWACGAYG